MVFESVRLEKGRGRPTDGFPVPLSTVPSTVPHNKGGVDALRGH